MKKTYLILSVISAAIIISDQITKCYVASVLPLHGSIPVIENFFSITHVRNPGAAFGFLAGAPAVFRSMFLVAATVAAIILIVYCLHKNRATERLLVISLSLILGGAAGNLMDRVRLGEVIDFLDIYVGAHHWPAFNVADSAISIGAVLLILQMIKRKKEN